MQHKKTIAGALALLLALTLLTGCGRDSTPAASAPTPAAQEPAAANDAQPNPGKGTLSITVANDTGYIFYELYITPTGDNSWGEDYFGSSSLLKKNGTFDLKVPKYDFETYDVRVVDEDDDVYLFDRAILKDKTTLHITFADDALIATSVFTDGTESAVQGYIESGSTDDEDAAQTSAGGGVATGYDVDGNMLFSIYNNSSFDIYSIHIGLPGMSADTDEDILPAILSAGDNTVIDVTIAQEHWNHTEWTLYVTDVDGDTSASYETFNPWLLSYVDIDWQDGGYVCSFVYP